MIYPGVFHQGFEYPERKFILAVGPFGLYLLIDSYVLHHHTGKLDDLRLDCCGTLLHHADTNEFI